MKRLTLCATIGVAQALNPRPAGAVHSPIVPQSLAATGLLSRTGCCGQVLPGRRRRVSDTLRAAPTTSPALTPDITRRCLIVQCLMRSFLVIKPEVRRELLPRF